MRLNDTSKTNFQLWPVKYQLKAKPNFQSAESTMQLKTSEKERKKEREPEISAVHEIIHCHKCAEITRV
jgi:hypothetical protein